MEAMPRDVNMSQIISIDGNRFTRRSEWVRFHHTSVLRNRVFFAIANSHLQSLTYKGMYRIWTSFPTRLNLQNVNISEVSPLWPQAIPGVHAFSLLLCFNRSHSVSLAWWTLARTLLQTSMVFHAWPWDRFSSLPHEKVIDESYKHQPPSTCTCSDIRFVRHSHLN